MLRGCAVAAVALGGLVMSPTASMAMNVQAPAKVSCATTAGEARVPHGVALASDPNTLSQTQIDAMEGRAARIIGNRGTLAARVNGSVTIPVHVHVIVRNNGSGNVANWRINRQIAVLNDGFSGNGSAAAVDTPFRFRLATVDRTRNTDWYDMDEADSVQARRALRMGDATHLNLYVTNFAGDLEGLLGFATFPTSYQSAPKLDGTVVWNESLPGGDAVFSDGQGTIFNYSEGDTATHEVGHWMNLYHTFQGSCGPNNDYVEDTPPQKADDNVFYCNVNFNTCGGPATAKDPVKNFMNYVDDVCMDRFSWGQRDRMNISWYIREALSS
jgi:hypothetical protein